MCFGAIVPLILYCLFEYPIPFFIVSFLSIGLFGALIEYIEKNTPQYENRTFVIQPQVYHKSEEEKKKKYQKRLEKLKKYNPEFEQQCKNNK